MVSTIDANATHGIISRNGQNQYVDLPVLWASYFGAPLLVFAVACQWWAQQNRKHTRHIILAKVLPFINGLALNQLVQLFVQRVRPYEAGVTSLLIPPSNDPSFPSDNATASFAIAATFLIHLFRGAVGFLAPAILISVSRIYLDIHYVSDVVAGDLTATLADWMVWWTYREGTRVDRFLTGIL